MSLGAVLGVAALGLLAAAQFAIGILRKDPGSDTMQRISRAIRVGALAFLRTEYSVIAVFAAAVFAVLWLVGQRDTALAFVAGAFASGLAGWLGMATATRANVRTTHAAHAGLAPALQIAFSSGMVMGLCVASLGLGGVALLYRYFGSPHTLFGFSFGASSIALFARVGGGIFTKAADVGADLVGKVEAGIPEDDPRNPAVVADNVGDNVGDVAGMGADLFESYVGAIIATMALGSSLPTSGGRDLVMLPLYLAACGLIGSLVGRLFVRASDEARLNAALFRGLVAASVVFVALAYLLIGRLEVGFVSKHGRSVEPMGIFWSVVIGLALGVAIGKITEYYTSERMPPARQIAAQSQTGTATNLIAGLAVGMGSTWAPIVLIAGGISLPYALAGLYGVSVAAVGMLATLGISLGVDAYGPVADNAGGIAQMSRCPPEVRRRTDSLDAVGNTTAAIGKGFAIGSAALTALALFQNYVDLVAAGRGSLVLDLLQPDVIAGVLVGAMLPYLFCSLTMLAVGRAAHKMVDEVRRQFREIPGLLEGRAEADPARCVAISAQGAIREMVLPALLAIVVPVGVGAFWSAEALGGVIVGTMFSGVVMAIFMANTGGAWDNAKKYIESGQLGGKGSATHKAAVVGDTVGDPLKDTAGPSLNILIKLMCIVSIVAVPVLFK